MHPCCQSRPPWRRCTSRKLQPASLDSCQPSAPKKGAEPIRDQVKRAGCKDTWAKGWIDIMAIVAISSPPLAAGICSVHVCFLLPSELTYVASTFASSIPPQAVMRALNGIHGPPDLRHDQSAVGCTAWSATAPLYDWCVGEGDRYHRRGSPVGN